jgi:hypothetical protein
MYQLALFSVTLSVYWMISLIKYIDDTPISSFLKLSFVLLELGFGNQIDTASFLDDSVVCISVQIQFKVVQVQLNANTIIHSYDAMM